MNIKEKLKNLFKKDKKLIIIVILGIVGILLIVFSEFIPSDEKKATQEETTKTGTEGFEEATEKRLAEIIGKIDGVGKVNVMVTLESSEEYEYAQNSKNDFKSEGEKKDNSNENEYVLLETSDGEQCVLIKSTVPKVRGAIIVCEGGDIQSVKSNVTNAVTSSLGVSANNVTVLKMKTTEEQ